MAVVFLAGCGKEERTEAVQLTKVLAEKQGDYSEADAIEMELVSSARAWCGGIAANGAGRGVELDQNAIVAAELAKSVVAVSTHLSLVRQAIYDQPLKKEYPQSIRNDLVTELTRRQRMLQDLRTLLEKSAAQFQEYRRNATYAGDSYPGEIAELDAVLQAYKAPPDAVGAALTSLKEKYNIGSDEL